MFEPAEPSQQKESNNIRCMICNRMENQRTLFAHISEHIGLKPHSCEHCDFQTAYECEAMRHESNYFGHRVRMNLNNNAYGNRMCRFVYNDCIFANKNGDNIERVLERPLLNNRSDAEIKAL